MKVSVTLPFIFSLFFCTLLIAQQPEDCGLPSPPGEDLCGDACVYCDLTANGYSGSTIGYTPDAPNNYCGTIENNQWFAFAAGTTTVEFTIIASNCQNGDGVQGAIYPDCNPNSPFIACDGGQNNGANLPIVVTANNLVIGQIYWFMVDGWLGDECDYDVTVTQGNTDPPPLDPPGPITGAVGCLGETVTFEIPPLPGASYYDWTLPDGSMINTENPFVDYTFGVGGQVCVQANNVCNFSDEVCITVDVVAPAAGTISVNTPLCPNETANISVAGYNNDPEFTQAILVADANGLIVSITNGGSTTFTHDECADFQVCTYNYVTATGTPPTIGMDVNTIDCDAECCEIVCQDFSFQDNELPNFPNAPGDLTLTCFDLLPPMEDQQWTDNCDGTGMVSGMESGSADLCSGGTLTRRWIYADACDNEGQHIQNITIEPPPMATFINPPGDMTVDCDNIPASGPDLSYTNNALGACAIDGMVSPVQSGNGDVCGGVITYTWEYTDQCNRTITHTQNITITPAPAPSFINPPGDITLDCDNIPASGPDLDYTNNGTGNCLFAGTVSPQQSGNADICGGIITYTWQFTDQCGNTINHTQNVTITPAPVPAFINPPGDMTVDCDNIPTGASPLDYSNNGPGSCLIEGSVTPVQTGSADMCNGGIIRYTWDFTDQCGNFITHTQNITVTPAPPTDFINPPGDMTVDCDNIPTSAPDLNYTNNGVGDCLFSGSVSPQQSGNADICGGVLTYTWQFTDPCGNSITHVQNITVTPAPPVAFQNPPGDMTVTCDNIPTSGDDLNYTNNGPGNCLIQGIVSPTQSGNADICGGVITYTWQFTDQCGNTINHVQNITVEPAPIPQFLNPPGDLTVDCDNIPTSAPDLNYTNNGPGSCLIEGTVSPQQEGSADICGGQFRFVWEFTDQCGNTINHIQNIIVNPPPPVTFINPPADITLSCDNIPNGGPNLDYTNNGSGACLFAGTVSPQESGNANICGGTIIYTWQFTDQCGNTINHVQNITIEPAPPPAFLNPPADITVSCDNIPTSGPDLQFTNNGPGNCLISGSVSPQQSGNATICGGTISYLWQFTDQCGNTISHIQNVTVDPAPIPAFINPPDDITVSCDNIPTGAPDLQYTNNASGVCLISGIITPTQMGNGSICGGTIIFDWTINDQCGNIVKHLQTVTITPAPAPTFVNPPPDMTVSCDNIPAGAPALTYTNNANGNCLIQGQVQPVQSGNANICGGTISFTWQFVDICGNPIVHTQNVTVDPAPEIAFINPPPDMVVNCEDVALNPEPLAYTNNANGNCLIAGSVQPVQSGSYNECGGNISYTWQFTSICGQTINHVQNITVNPAPPPAFTGNLPVDITVSCDNVSQNPEFLEFSNNSSGACLIAGTIPPVQSGSFDVCGGVLTNDWTFTDNCGNTIQHQQVITVDPAPMASFISPPGPLTLNCNEVQPVPPLLNYSNNAFGICAINGVVPAIQSGFYDECGGNLQYTWVFLDECNRTISHTQNITVNPAPDPMFFNPPPDLTINCGEDFPPPNELVYTNNQQGICDITGSVPAVVFEINNLEIEYTWTYFNPCSGNILMHTQHLTKEPEPDIYIDPLEVTICQGQSFDLANIFVGDLNNTNPTITYHNATPAFPGNQLPSTVVMPNVSTTYYILAFTDSGCSDEASFTVNVEEPPFAGMGTSGTICYENSNGINLFDYLQGDPDQDGEWVDVGNTGVNLSNPYDVNLGGFPADTYLFDYIVYSEGICPNSQTMVELELLPEVIIEVLDIACTNDPDIYEVLINSNGFEILVNTGTINDLGNNQISITDISIQNNLIISATNPGHPECFQDINISAPDCDCPTVDPPVNNGNQSICEGEPVPELSVTVGVDETANWYDAPVGGTLLLQGSTTYTPTATAPGVYEFYVEAENILTGCKSLVRTLIRLTIFANPTGIDAMLDECDEDGDGFVLFNLTQAQPLISTNPGYTYTFYETQSDAENQSNPVDLNYTNTLTPTQVLYVVITNQQGCTAIVQLTLTVYLPPAIDLEINDESCLEDADGNVSINAPSGVNYSLDGANWTTGNTFTDLPAGNYTAFVEDANGCISSEDFSIDQGLDLVLNEIETVCDNNGTPSDPSDDFYTITFTLGNIPGVAGSYTVNDGTGDLGTFNYDEPNSVIVAAQDQSFTLTFTDDNFACSTEEAVGPLLSCSSDCVMSLDLLENTCSDNGTPADPSDDFYTVNINASAINGAANNTYNVLIDNVLSYNFPYNQISSFTLPANGISPEITVADNQFPGCQVSQIIGPLNTCSDDCILTAAITNILCNDMGTGNDPNDDTYTFDLMVSGQNLSTGWQDADGNYSGTYGQSQQFGPFLISDGDFSITIMDNVNQTCAILANAETPLACSFCGQSVEAGQGTVLNCEITQATLDGTSSEPGSYIWTGPNNFQDDTLLTTTTEPGWYYLTAEYAGSCSAVDSVLIELDDSVPTADASPDQTLSCDVLEIELQGSGTTASGNTSYEWLNTINQPVSNAPTLSTSISGIYTLIITDESNGCTISDEVEVFENNEAPTAIAADPDTLTCETSLVNLDGSLSTGNGNLAYEWFDAGGNSIGTSPTVTVGNSGDYLLVVTDIDNNCNSSVPVNVPENMDTPLAMAEALDQITCTNTSVTLDGTNSSGNGALSYEWLNPGQNTIGNAVQITVGATGIYTLIVTDTESNCTAETSVEVFGDPDVPVADATVSGIIDCQNNEVLLDGSGSSGNGTLDYEWFDGSDISIGTSVNISISVPGDYYLVVTDTDNGCTSEASLQVLIDTLSPEALIVDPQDISCFNPEVNLDASNSSGNGPLSFSWYNENNDLVGSAAILNVEESGIYSVLVTNTENGCTAQSEVEVLGNADVPVADAGTSTTLTCDINTAELNASASTGSGILSFEWFDDNGESITNTPVTQVSQPGIYTVVVSFENGCSDEASVEILANGDIPTVDAGPNEVLDCNVSQVTLGSSNTSAGTNISYQWFDGSGMLVGTNQFLDVQDSGTYTLEVTNTDNNCQVSDQVIISEDYDAPIVDPGPEGTLTCETTNILLGGTGSSSGDEYTYEWQNANQDVLGNNATLEVTSPGIYTLYIFNTENGCSANASVEVFENLETPSSEPGLAQELTCDSASVTLDGSNSTGNNIIFEWLDENLNSIGDEAVINVGSSGTYTLIVTNTQTGCTDQAAVVVTTNDDVPTAVPWVQGVLTCEISSVVLDGSLSTSNSGNLSYQWYDAQGTVLGDAPTVNVQDPGTYTLLVTDPENGCSSEAEVEVQQDIDAPVAEAGNDQTLTCAIASVTLSGSAANGQNFSFEWFDDNPFLIGTTANIDVSSTGIYELVITNLDNGCTASDFVEVVPDNNIPVANAGVGGTLTCDVLEIILDGTGSASGPSIEYEWQDENNVSIGNGLTISVTEPGVYTLVVLDNANNCLSQDNVVVDQNIDTPTAFIDQIGALDCNNQSLVLDGGGSSPAGNLDFLWSTNNGNIVSGENTPNPEIDEPGLYTLTVTDQINGCTHTTSMLIDQDIEVPQLVIANPDLLTCLITEIIIDAGNSSSNGNFIYSWTSIPAGGIISGEDSLSPSINQAGTYTLTILNLDNGCETSDFVVVSEDTTEPTAVAMANGEFDCITDYVLINGDGSSAGNQYTYLWTGPGIITPITNLQVSVDLAGIYALEVTDNLNGCTASVSINVDENDNQPSGLQVLQENPLCFGDRGSIEILEVQGGTPPYLYSIDGGENYYPFTYFGYLNSGTYEVIVQDANGCEYQEIFVLPEVQELFVDLGIDIVIELGSSTTLNAVVNIPEFLIDSVNWSPIEGLSCTDCLRPEVMPLNETLYQVTVTDVNGCTARDEIMLRVRKDRGIYIPNVFTPHNGDGINDGFMIFSGIDDVEKVDVFQVFDRWGELVFEDYDFQPNDPAHSWDGTLRGEPMNPAVFVYWARITFIDGVTLLYKGDVTLIR